MAGAVVLTGRQFTAICINKFSHTALNYFLCHVTFRHNNFIRTIIVLGVQSDLLKQVKSNLFYQYAKQK